MKVTKREILFSIIIVALMAILGIFIGSKIVENNTERNEKYYLALKIDNNEELDKSPNSCYNIITKLRRWFS